MIKAECKYCGAVCYLAVNERNGKVSENYYSERVLSRLIPHEGGKAKAVPVHGLYEVHHCNRSKGGRHKHFVLPREKPNRAGARGRIPARVARLRRRKNFEANGT